MHAFDFYWVLIGPYNFLFVLNDFNGSLCVLIINMHLYTCLWVFIGHYASLRVLMCLYRSVCVLMGPYKSLCVFIDSNVSL